MKLHLKSFAPNWVFILVLLFLTSCKSTKIVGDGKVDESLTAKTVIKNHYKNFLDVGTISGKMKIDYATASETQSFSVSLRMEKDKVIWISAPLGIVKAYISPDRVSFYNKLENEYFDGDFSYLSNLLGTELDFDKVQNLLFGQALLDLRDDKYDLELKTEAYELKPKRTMDLFKTLFQIEPKNFKIASQQLSQPWEKRLLEIRYNNYQQVESNIIPSEVEVIAVDKDEQTTIAIEYRNIEFNRNLNFPYKIPKGFEEIVLK